VATLVSALGETRPGVRAPSARSARALRAIERRRMLGALALVAPLLAFLIVNFAWPIGVVLMRSVKDVEIPAALPRTAAAIGAWDGSALPDASVAALLVDELGRAKEEGTLSGVANRLNYDVNGFRTLLLSTARRLPLSGSGNALDQLIALDARWGDAKYWASIKHAAQPFTSFYLLAAVDRRMDARGDIVRTAPEQRVFVDVFARTFWVSLVVTALCLVMGFPLAYLLANVDRRIGNLLMILVLLPLWTSVLVRTTGWAVLLQREGFVNYMLRSLGVIAEPIQMIYNRTGVYIAMTHVLLPFMVLPLYSVMKGIAPTTMRAALSLGAPPAVAFRRVYLPQCMPGISAGCLLVFILALGYYVTPALVGGAQDQMVSYFIAFYTNETLNWGMAAALAVILLAVTLILYAIYNRLSTTSGPRWA
jgi:putative spermidine/putrescine transport system permease protein